MTPYQYGGLDPIKHIDVNGDSIWVVINTTSIDANGQSNTVTNRYYYGADKNGHYGFLDNNGTFNHGTWQTVSLPNGKTRNIKKAEIYATHMENKIRAENGLPLRVSYGVDCSGKADPSTRIIRSGTNQSLYYNSNGITNYRRLKRSATPFSY